MISELSLFLFIAAAPQTVILYGGDSTLAAELAAQLDPQKWSVQSASPTPILKTGHQAVEKFNRGKLAYDDLMFEEALPALSAAREEYERLILEPEQWAGYLQTLLYLALTLDGMAKTEQSDAVLDALAALAPGMEILNESFPPPFRRKVGERLQKHAFKTGSLRIESKPAGANILLNGRFRGRTPLLITELPGGNHTVSLVLAGHVTITRKVAVVAGFGIGAEATPDLLEVTLAPSVDISSEQALKLVAAQRLPDRVLTTAVQNSQRDTNKAVGIYISAAKERTVFAVLPTKGQWHGPATVGGDGLTIPPLRARLISQIVNWLDAPEPIAKAPFAAAPAKIKKETSSRWWLWTGLGILVAGGATAAVVAAQSPDKEETTGDVVVGW